jgi:hypothetical protein
MVTVTYPSNGEWYTYRAGSAKSLADCHRLIAEEKKAMANTFGGLISALPRKEVKKRTYRIWRAKWTEIPFA